MDPLFLISLVLISSLQGVYGSCPGCVSKGAITGFVFLSMIVFGGIYGLIKLCYKHFHGEKGRVGNLASIADDKDIEIGQQQNDQLDFEKQPAYGQPM